MKDFVLTILRGETNEDEFSFKNVFKLAGCQPVQKWLKDRKGIILTNCDIEHYQKIIVALSETDRIMKEIDTIVK